MTKPVKIQQVELVVAILQELGKQGITELTLDTFSPVMTVCIEAANEIKSKVEALNIVRNGDILAR